MAAHEPLQDALARMKENLEANNNLHASTRAIVGPALEIVPAGEKFSTTEIYEPVNGPTR